LILKVHQSVLHADSHGGLARQAHHFPENYGTRMKYEPGHDYVWLTEPEWKSLIPESPRKGQSFALPASITEQIAYNLRDTSRLGRSFPSVIWKPKTDIRAQDLKVIVEDVGPTLRLRLEGPIRLKESAPESGKEAARFDGRLLGYLDYDTAKKSF